MLGRLLWIAEGPALLSGLEPASDCKVDGIWIWSLKFPAAISRAFLLSAAMPAYSASRAILVTSSTVRFDGGCKRVSPASPSPSAPVMVYSSLATGLFTPAAVFCVVTKPSESSVAFVTRPDDAGDTFPSCCVEDVAVNLAPRKVGTVCTTLGRFGRGMVSNFSESNVLGDWDCGLDL